MRVRVRVGVRVRVRVEGCIPDEAVSVARVYTRHTRRGGKSVRHGSSTCILVYTSVYTIGSVVIHEAGLLN